MEEKTYYSVANLKENGLENKDITYIPLEKIVLDPGMEFAGRQFCHEILKTKKVKTLRDGLETNLYKWDKVSKDFIEKKEMDPVKLCRFKKTDYYTVIDGRHRCMLSFYHGYSHIGANLFV
jgi:hypothetical protein|tara:strand:+ start:162 stop:524 length:363 start_codon:yes stop_codon:yes gene_type:complete